MAVLENMGRKMPRSVIFLFLLALLIRVSYTLFFVELEYLLTEDQSLYIQFAQDFSDSGFLGLSTERVPGYPFFISVIYDLFGKSIWNIVLIQILLDSISCVLIAIMAQSLFSKGFWISGMLSAINLNMIIASASILSDTLSLFLFILFLLSLVQYLQNERAKWFFLLVVFISLASLVRPSFYYLLPILLIGLVSWRLWNKDAILKIGALSVLYIVVVVVLIGGIHKSNYQQYGSTALVSQTGTHILGWVIPATYQYSGQGNYQEGQQLSRERLNLALQRDHLTILPSNPFESSAYQANVGKELLFEFGFVNILKAWTVGSAINLLAPSVAYSPALRSMDHLSFYETKGNGVFNKVSNYIKNSSGFLYLLILIVGTILSAIFFMLALVGVFKINSVLPPITVATLLLLVGYFLAITGPIIGAKYRLPIDPILTLFVTSFLNRFLEHGNTSEDTY